MLQDKKDTSTVSKNAVKSEILLTMLVDPSGVVGSVDLGVVGVRAVLEHDALA